MPLLCSCCSRPAPLQGQAPTRLYRIDPYQPFPWAGEPGSFRKAFGACTSSSALLDPLAAICLRVGSKIRNREYAALCSNRHWR
jgi:hypothetical protein